MSGVQLLKRYRQLGLRDALCIPYRYPCACDELNLILRKAYNEVPKSIQSLIFQDVLAAYRLLPQMQTQSAVSAAHTLRNTADRILPKQKKVIAISEFKQAKIAHKRLAKAHQKDRDSGQLPQDVLVHLFSFLDMQSLVSAEQVCRSWNEAANENCLWQSHYASYFVDLDSSIIMEKPQGSLSFKDCSHTHNFNWKDAFRQKYVGFSSRKFKYSRGYCAHCGLIVWPNGVKCPNKHFGKRAEDLHIVSMLPPSQLSIKFLVVALLMTGLLLPHRLIMPHRLIEFDHILIIAYLVNDTLLNLHYSDSDSSDDETGFWVNPKQFFER